MNIKRQLYDLRRKLWGKYEIDDPRPIKAESPYTFYLPNENHLQAVEIGDTVKIMFRSIPQGIDYDVERMWVIVNEINGENFVGSLDNDPFDIPQLKAYDTVEFKRWHIIDCQWKNPEKENLFKSQPSNQIWDRCLVDNCVLNRKVPVDYLYREEPNMENEDDKYPDSGWRIRGDVELMTDEEYDNDDASYIALGKVLNQDDSWIHLIDEPFGSRFFKNKQTGKFERE